jgi:hypothetical protein
MPLIDIIIFIVLAAFLILYAIIPRIEPRIFVALTLLLLALSGTMLILEKPILSNQIAGYAFYSLVLGIILLLTQRLGRSFIIPYPEPRIFVALTLLLLALSGMMLILEKPILSNQIAGYAFYSLVLGIILLLTQRFRELWIKK